MIREVQIMNNKIETLKDLIEDSKLETQVKLNKIIQTLQKTDDIIKARILSTKILTGDFTNLRESAIDNLIESFTIMSPTIEVATTEDKIVEIDDGEDTNKNLNLEYELRLMNEKMARMENEYQKKIERLNNHNEKLESLLYLTETKDLIEVSDEEINELYIRYLKDKETSYKNAVVIENIIPKSYYKIK